MQVGGCMWVYYIACCGWIVAKNRKFDGEEVA